MEYINRNRKTYYLREGKTKTGKPRYYFTAKENDTKGTPVDKIPEGYEVYERPENAQVFLRKKCPRLITEQEEQFVKKSLEQLQNTNHYLIDCKDEYLTIYEAAAGMKSSESTPAMTIENLRSQLNEKNLVSLFGGLDNFEKALGEILNPGLTPSDQPPLYQNYMAVLRFTLVDKDKRTFGLERFCFLGAIDDWIYLDGPDDCRNLANKYLKLLGTDEFYGTPYL